LTWISLGPVVWLASGSSWLAAAMAGLGLIYLVMQQPDSDDHLIIQQGWGSVWSFLTSPPRRE
jgi:hypothetical protein